MTGTLPNLLERAAEGPGRMTFHLDGGPVELTHRELSERAEGLARVLADRGVGRGDRVGLLGPNRPEWAAWAWATWRAAATLVPLAFPMRIRDPEAFGAQLTGLAKNLDLRTIVADPDLLPFIPEETAVDWRTRPRGGAPAPPGPGPEDPATIQLTSGSTAEPKGALLTHGTIVTHVTDRRGTGSGHPIVWVPFFHDWGLVNHVIRSVDLQRASEVLPTERFARDPAEWFRLVAPTGADTLAGPPSALAAAIAAAERDPSGIDLSGVTAIRLGAESVAPSIIDRILDFGGFTEDVIDVGYGLAEAVLGVTSTRSGRGFRFDVVDLGELAANGRAVPAAEGPTKRVPCCGRPYRGFAVRVVDPEESRELPDRHVGEIRVKGPAMMHSYIGQDPPNAFVDGWLCTGDLGYLADGDLYVTGRLKDMIIVSGANYYPEDFEWAAERVEGVRAGRCAAFSRSEREIVVVVEPREGAEPGALARSVRDVVGDAVGIRPAEVVVVPRGTVPKTTSGKVRRGALRDAYLAGDVPGEGRA